MWPLVLLLVEAGLTEAINGEPSLPFRPPVSSYVAPDPKDHQSVLVEPSGLHASQAFNIFPTASLQAEQKVENNGVVQPRPFDASEDRLDDIPPIASRNPQGVRLGNHKGHYLPSNRTDFLYERLRQQMDMRKGVWRSTGSGARVRPGLSRLRGHRPLLKRRRYPTGSMSRKWKDVLRQKMATQKDVLRRKPATPEGVLRQKTVTLEGVLRQKTATPEGVLRQKTATPEGVLRQKTATPEGVFSQKKTPEADFHDFRSEESSSTDTVGSRLPLDKLMRDLKGKDTSTHRPVTFHRDPNNAPNSMKPLFALSKTVEKRKSPLPLADFPSVHDMTSMHYKPGRNDTSAAKNQSLSTKLREANLIARTTTQDPQTSTTTVPIFITPSTTLASKKTSPDIDIDILGSIQSIFQSVKTDERQLSSMKKTNLGNSSPKPLDIFSAASPTYGFKPSQRIESLFDRVQNQQMAKTVKPPSTIQPWVSTQKPQPPSVKPDVIIPQHANDGNYLVHVGNPLSFRAEQDTETVKDRMGEDSSDDVIVGIPAAHIQGPQRSITLAPVTSTAPAAPEMRTEPDQLQYQMPEESREEYVVVSSPTPNSGLEGMEPLINYIKNKYNAHSVRFPASVTSLHSLIDSGRIPQVFQGEEVLQHIKDNQHRFRWPPIDRIGTPWMNELENTNTKPQMKTETGTSSSFVAISGIALLAAICGYLLYTNTEPLSESRNMVNPLKAAIHEARNGLHLILNSLDEYEEFLDNKEKDDKEKPSNIPQIITKEKVQPQNNIPVILTSIWNKMVPPEVKISTGPVNLQLQDRKHVNASALIRGSRIADTGFRQPHAIEISDIQLNSSLNNTANNDDNFIPDQSQFQFSSPNAILNSFLNSQLVKDFMSKLKNSTLNPMRRITEASRYVTETMTETTTEQQEDPPVRQVVLQASFQAGHPSDHNIHQEEVRKREEETSTLPDEGHLDYEETTTFNTYDDSETTTILHEFDHKTNKDTFYSQMRNMEEVNTQAEDSKLITIYFEKPEVTPQETGMESSRQHTETETQNPKQTEEAEHDRGAGASQEEPETPETREELATHDPSTTEPIFITFYSTSMEEDPPTTNPPRDPSMTRAIINNRLYVHHSPAVDKPPKAFVNNVPMKPVAS